jgi:predicted RNA binding protein YcfA (HicA-like mRNA interferase family)
VPKLPIIKAKELMRILEKPGFECKRQRGSHMFYEHPDGRTTIIPNHPSESVDRGLLSKIINQDLKISRETFLQFF